MNINSDPIPHLSLPGIIDQLFVSAAKGPHLTTDERTEQIKNINYIIKTLNEAKTADRPITQAKLCDRIIKELNTHSKAEWKKFAELVANNTLTTSRSEGSVSGKYQGMYPCILELFKVITEIKSSEEVLNRQSKLSKTSPDDLTCLEKIKEKVLESIQEIHTSVQATPLDERDIRRYIIAQTSETFGKLSRISKQYERLTKGDLIYLLNKGEITPLNDLGWHLVDLLNKGEHTFKDLGLQSIQDLADYLGKKKCEKVKTLLLIPLETFISRDDDTCYPVFEKKVLDKNFPNLKHISIDESKNLQKLASFRCFWWLDCTKTGLSPDLKFLVHCPSLRELSITSNAPIDFSFLKQSPQLSHNIRAVTLTCPLKDKNFQDLVFLKRLKYLDLSSVENLEKLDFLEHTKDLLEFRLGWCPKIKDYQPLIYLKKLELLELRRCKHLGNLDFLKHKENLKSLDLIGCAGIKDFQDLGILKKLKQLDLNGCKNLGNLDFLEHTQELESLNLRRCTQIKNYQPLSYLKKLKLLEIDANEITDALDYSKLVPSLTRLAKY